MCLGLLSFYCFRDVCFRRYLFRFGADDDEDGSGDSKYDDASDDIGDGHDGGGGNGDSDDFDE